MTVKELREKSGMTQKSFAEYLGCSERTVEAWEYKRSCKPWICDLIEYKLRHEGLLKETTGTKKD